MPQVRIFSDAAGRARKRHMLDAMTACRVAFGTNAEAWKKAVREFSD